MILSAEAADISTMLTQQAFSDNLNRFYAAIDKNYDDRTNTKKWSLSLWLAVIAFLSSHRQPMPYFAAIILLCVPIMAFWFLEATQGAYGKILIDKALEMERLSVREWHKIESPEKYLYLSGRHASMRMKASATLYAAFAMETVFFFYLLLLGLSLVFIYFMQG